MARVFSSLVGLLSVVALSACLSTSSTVDTNAGYDAGEDSAVTTPTTDAAPPPITDGAPPPPVAEAGAFGPHGGASLLPGAVRATSSGHVLVTTTGQNPGGSPTMRSSKHTVLGGSVGGTQSP